MAGIELKLDTSSLDRAMDLAESWSESTPAFLVIRTAQRITSKLKEYTPFVSQETIDTELEVVFAPGKTPTGRLSKQKKYTVPMFGAEQDAGSGRSLAYMIQLARMAPGSEYNRLTNNRWRLPAGFEMLKGMDKAGRTTVLQALADRMLKARHSSTHFLVAGWASAAKKIFNLRGFSERIEGGENGGSSLDEGFSEQKVSPKPNMSEVNFTTSKNSATITVENRIGLEDSRVNGSNAVNYNEALIKYGTQPLQRAIDEVAAEMTEHYMAKDMREMAAAFNAIR
jgi:hypothetical protein